VNEEDSNTTTTKQQQPKDNQKQNNKDQKETCWLEFEGRQKLSTVLQYFHCTDTTTTLD